MELGGKMVLQNGLIKDRPTYLDTPQYRWTKAQHDEAVRDQQDSLQPAKPPKPLP